MNKIENNFVPYQESLELKELGFDEECFGYHNMINHSGNYQFDRRIWETSDNYIEANPMVTPSHIVPEWYFLPFYAVLRAIPDKLYGVILMIFSIVFMGLFPFFLHLSKQTNFVPQSDFIEFYFVELLHVLLFVLFY